MTVNLLWRSFAHMAFTNLALFATVSFAHAATITVTNTNDSGAGSLRQAVIDASPRDTINFSVTGTITLASEIPIAKSLTIQGPASPGIIVDGNDAVRVFTSARIRSSCPCSPCPRSRSPMGSRTTGAAF